MDCNLKLTNSMIQVILFLFIATFITDISGQIISQIMEHCRRLSGSVNVDFPPQKLRPGYGTFVTDLLHDLAEAALKVSSSPFHGQSWIQTRTGQIIFLNSD